MSSVEGVPVYVDDAGYYVSGDEVGAFRPGLGLRRPAVRDAILEGDAAVRAARQARRAGIRDARLAGRAGADLRVAAESIRPSSDSLALANQAGLVTKNQIMGLGSSIPVASASGNINASVQRACWIRGLVLDSDSPAYMAVTQITLAGIPKTIGTAGSPLSMFLRDATRFGMEFAPVLAQVGQVFQVNFTNLDAAAAHVIQGGLVVDELNPYAAQRVMENMVFQAISAQVN